jgi:hypothetical protein
LLRGVGRKRPQSPWKRAEVVGAEPAPSLQAGRGAQAPTEPVEKGGGCRGRACSVPASGAWGRKRPQSPWKRAEVVGAEPAPSLQAGRGAQAPTEPVEEGRGTYKITGVQRAKPPCHGVRGQGGRAAALPPCHPLPIVQNDLLIGHCNGRRIVGRQQNGHIGLAGELLK